MKKFQTDPNFTKHKGNDKLRAGNKFPTNFGSLVEVGQEGEVKHFFPNHPFF